ncbi:MAG: aminodeoxychorismate/anthranilate synthase component II [Nanoarchaeota archaeon]
MNVLFIDNFDSFTYNLVDEFQKRDCEVLVFRNNVDMKTLDKEIKKFKPNLIVISPGPGCPKESGNCIDIIKNYYSKIPLFGVCLGHQCMIEAFDGIVSKAPEIIHGKPSKIKHDNEGIFKDLENPFQAGRYHSLIGIDIPYCFEVSARTTIKGLVMGIRHKEYPVYGVQFHPESILTPIGGLIIENLIKMCSK